MARIAGVELPRDKRVEISLTYIYGIGRITAQEIIKKVGIDPGKKINDLAPDEVQKLRSAISDYRVEGDLRRERAMNIKGLMDLGNYAGLRHRRGLPVRGQRTKTNARTRKGHRKTVGGK